MLDSRHGFIDLVLARETHERRRDGRLGNIETDRRLHDVAVLWSLQERQTRRVARDQPAAQRIHRDDADIVPRSRVQRLRAKGEIQGVIADRDAFKEAGIEHGRVVLATQVRRDDQMFDQTFLPRLLRRANGALANPFFELVGTQQAPDMKEIDVVHLQAPERFLEAGPQFTAVRGAALGGDVKRRPWQRPKRVAHDLLALVLAVEWSGVEVVDSPRMRVTHHGGRGIEIGWMGETHATEADNRHINARLAVRFGPHRVKREKRPDRSGARCFLAKPGAVNDRLQRQGEAGAASLRPLRTPAAPALSREPQQSWRRRGAGRAGSSSRRCSCDRSSGFSAPWKRRPDCALRFSRSSRGNCGAP